MAGFASVDDLINEVTANGKLLEEWFNKITTGSIQGEGTWTSLWRFGTLPVAGSDPATTPGTAYDNDDSGLAKWADQDPDEKRLMVIEGMLSSSNIQGRIFLYDRLVGVSGLGLSSTGNKTVSSTALPRYTDGKGVEAWLEITTATATTAPIVSINSYTDQDGNTGAAGPTLTFPAAATVANSLIGPLPLADGDYGIRAVSTLNVATAGSAGVCNLILLKPLAQLSISSVSGHFDLLGNLPSMPRIYDGATLGLAFVPDVGNSVTNQLWGRILAAYG